jgi:hypothetical protein
VVYIGVILFFVFMQFQAREQFDENVGSLALSGVYARTLGGAQRMRHLEVRFHGLRLEFSPSSTVTVGLEASREKNLSLEGFSRFPDGFELTFDEEVGLRFTVEGALGERVAVTPLLPPRLQNLTTFAVPFQADEGDLEAVNGIPVAVHRGASGMVYASMRSGSQIDVEGKRFIVDLESQETATSIVMERMYNQIDPYLYWFSRDFALIDEQQFTAQVESYLYGAYQYWNGLFLSNPGSQELIGKLGVSLISEAIKRGEYRRTLAVLSRNLRQLLAGNAENPQLYDSAAYLGNLPAYLALRQDSAAEEIQRITGLITTADFSVFRTPRLLRFILNHAPFSLAEEVLRLADSVQLGTAELDTLIHLVNVYLEASEYLDVGEATSVRISDIIDRFVLPEILKTPRGLFLGGSSNNRDREVDLHKSVLMGKALMGAGRALANDSYTAVGRALISAALDLSDDDGFLPRRIRTRDGTIESTSPDTISPQSIYDLLPGADYTPEEYPLYAYLYPGSWIWTASRMMGVNIDDTRYRFSFSFPLGDTHYLLIQGIRPPTGMIMHGIAWKSDPEYFRYTDGWAYDEETQTLYVKITHRLETEELVLSY